MSNHVSTETIQTLANPSKSVEEIKLEERISLLDNILSNPNKTQRKVYEATHIYDERGNLKSDSWEHQLRGAAGITMVPTVGVYVTSLVGCLVKNNTLPKGLLITMGSLITAQALAVFGTNAYMTMKGSETTSLIKDRLITNLESQGYEVKNPLLDKLSLEQKFSMLLERLINLVSINKYENYEEDLSKLERISKNWDTIYTKAKLEKRKTYVPIHLLSEYHFLQESIMEKINKCRYQSNNEKLINGEIIPVQNSEYIKLAQTDELIVNISQFLKRIEGNYYEGIEEDIAKLKELAHLWLQKNIEEYEKTGKYLPSHMAPIQEAAMLKENIHRKINKAIEEPYTLRKK